MAKIPDIVISGASVKVMRSYDYCHFEVNLSTVTAENEGLDEATVDELRKKAARLADKAVEQYAIAKAIAERQTNTRYRRGMLEMAAQAAEETPEDQRTPEQKAAIKALEDWNFQQQFEYDYDDDFDPDDFLRDRD